MVTTAEGEIDFELTKRLGFMVDKAVLTGTVDRGSRLEQLASRPARSGLTTTEGQWYALGEQFVFRRYDWRQMRTEDLISLYDRVGEIYQQVEMSGEQKTQIVQMIEELKKQERALGA